MPKDKDLFVKEYRGVKVYLSGSNNPRFWASHAGLSLWGGSFETLRKKLDEVTVFKPFDALKFDRYGVAQVRVIGVDMDNEAWSVLEDGDTNARKVPFYNKLFPLNMRDKMEGFSAECEQWDKIEADMESARTEMQNELDGQAIPRPDK